MRLSQKDLLYLGDEAHWELLAAKKSYQYAHNTTQPEVIQLLHQIGQMHQQHCEQILHILQNSAPNTMPAPPSPGNNGILN
ncbi:hypothetical protein [Pasteuria penetrans]|uniref:hypothetical protein n=1 Tax=Pasteuria penetrans TaxID=86005 RepID=UPI000FA05C77|nr:hypothetical protein [Pasteuria penetrans]